MWATLTEVSKVVSGGTPCAAHRHPHICLCGIPHGILQLSWPDACNVRRHHHVSIFIPITPSAAIGCWQPCMNSVTNQLAHALARRLHRLHDKQHQQVQASRVIINEHTLLSRSVHNMSAPVYSIPSNTMTARSANHGPYFGCSERQEGSSQKDTPAAEAMRCSSRLGPPITPSRSWCPQKIRTGRLQAHEKV